MSIYSDPAQFENGKLATELPPRALDAVKAKPAKSLVDPDAAKADFEAAMRTRGIIPPKGGVLGDGELHRCDVDAEGNRGKGDGAYVLHIDGLPAGGFQNHRDGKGWENWRADIGRELTPSEREEYCRKMEDASAKREADKAARQAEAEKQAHVQISKSALATDDHPYLVDRGVKGFGAYYSAAPVQISPWRASAANVLLIPMRDIAGNLRSLQIIDTIRNKDFLRGGRVSGCFFHIGDFSAPDIICVAEGFATGASIFEATGFPTAVAFNAGNLPPVAKALRQKYPHARIVLCADDDAWTAGNPGITDATKAAESVGGVVAAPVFENRQVGETDFNDLHAAFGLDVVREQILVTVSRFGQARCEHFAGWGEPTPIDAPLFPVAAFDPVVLLPEPLRLFVMDAADRMPCPPEFIAGPLITALGSVIGAQCVIRPKAQDDWEITPNLWGGTVGSVSAKKSPSQAAALKPLNMLVAKAKAEHEKEQKAFEVDNLISSAKREAIEANIKSAAKSKSSGSSDINMEDLKRSLISHGENVGEEPKLRRYKTNDTTIEKLGVLLRDNPNGLLISRDELVGFLASFEREGREGDREFYLEAWNGTNDFDTDRIGRGSIFIPNLCVSIYGGIQPDKLIGYLEQAANALANDGLLQRFQMLVYPDPIKWEYRDRRPDAKAREDMYNVFEKLADLKPVKYGAKKEEWDKFAYFHFSDAAQDIFIEFSTNMHLATDVESNTLIAQHLAKYEKLFAALSLIFHLVDCAYNGVRGDISEASALRAASWCQYLETHARRCYGLLADQGLRAAQVLAANIAEGKLADGFTANDVRRHGWRYLKAIADIEPALDWLEHSGWVRAERAGPTDKGGRPTFRYSINPKIKAKMGEKSNG